MTIENFVESFKPNYDLISYVVVHQKSAWYSIPVPYWLMDQWSQFDIPAALSDENKLLLFLEKVEKYKLSNSFLKEAYELIEVHQDNHKRSFMHPIVYCNIDKKIFYTTYGEVALEESLLLGWQGQVAHFDYLISEKDKFWVAG